MYQQALILELGGNTQDGGEKESKVVIKKEIEERENPRNLFLEVEY